VIADLDTRCGAGYASDDEVLPQRPDGDGAGELERDRGVSCAGDGFARSRERFESTLAWLEGQDAAAMAHGELEARLEVDARELYRLLLQDHLDVRAEREMRIEQVRGADGVRRGCVEAGHRRPLGTVFGEVGVSRIAYRARGQGQGNLCPADALLNLPVETHSHGLRRHAAIEASRGSFDDAAVAIKRTIGQQLGKRMAEVGAVYDITPTARTAADILPADDAQRAAATPPPAAKNKWLTASVVADATTVVGEIFDEAERRDPKHARDWVALVDGNNHQIDRITTEAKTREVNVTIVVDLVHVLEYLWKAAWSFHREGDPAAELWVARHAQQILAGHATRVAGQIRRQATNAALDPPARTGADTCATYLTNTWTTPRPCSVAGRSRPASSRAPAATSSKTAWTSPAPAGAYTAPRRSSNSARSAATATSTSTGPTTSPKNATASTTHATPTTPSRAQHEPHSTGAAPYSFGCRAYAAQLGPGGLTKPCSASSRSAPTAAPPSTASAI
jgi:hypothetical protein